MCGRPLLLNGGVFPGPLHEYASLPTPFSPSKNHPAQAVVKALTVVVPSVDETRARNCYETSKSLGMAIVTSCLKEHAEHYRQQLFQYRLRTSIEPDGTVA